MIALHSPSSVLSRRHVPSWLLLAASAGAVNTIAFLGCSKFVTHVTGTVSHVGLNALDFTIDAAAVLVGFVLGAMTSAALVDARAHNQGKPLHAATLLSVAGILAGVSALGAAGAFGGFGDQADGVRGAAFPALLSFAMGLQNAAVAASTGQVIRTTHLTGPATDLGVQLTTALRAPRALRTGALRNAALRAGLITAFALGGAAGASLASSFAYGALLVPASAVATATALSFTPSTVTTTSKETSR